MPRKGVPVQRIDEWGCYSSVYGSSSPCASRRIGKNVSESVQGMGANQIMESAMLLSAWGHGAAGVLSL